MKKILIITLALLLGSLTYSQVSYNQEFQVNTYTDGDQSIPSVTRLSNGGFVVCWQSYGQDGSEFGIFAQIYDENGTKVGNEFRVNTYTIHHQELPSVAVLSNGTIVICWHSFEQDGDRYGIYAQLFNENGVKIGNEFRVNNKTINDQRNPDISAISNERFIICWQSDWQDGSEHGVYAQMYDSTGTKIGNEFQVNSHTIDHQWYPSVSGLENAGFVITWISNDQNRSGVYAQMYDENGQKLGAEFQVTTNYSFTSISSISNNKFIIVWSGWHPDLDNSGIYAQMYDENGNTFGEAFQLNTYTENRQEWPEISKLSNGRIVICWQSLLQDGDNYGIYAQMYDENGNTFGEEFQVNTYTKDWQWHPSVCEIYQGGFVITWDSYEQDGSKLGVLGKYFLGEPLNHNLTQFDLIEPGLDETINTNNPKFQWNQSSNIHINLPWELTYDLYIDDNTGFTNPVIIAGIQDTTCKNAVLNIGQTYYWKVLAKNITGDSLWSSDVFGFYIDPNATNITEVDAPLPESFELFQNYPNPFNPTTKIKFAIPAEVKGEMSNVKLTVYDILGNEIATLVDEQKQPGIYEVEFDGTGLTSGIYFYNVSAGQYSITKKMLLMK